MNGLRDRGSVRVNQREVTVTHPGGPHALAGLATTDWNAVPIEAE